jgi:hypothetical protein
VAAARAGISRNTLRAAETGDPATAIGNYLRIMSVLGISGELALLAGYALGPSPAGSAGALTRRAAPSVELRIFADDEQHRLQDLRSLALHEEAVRLAKNDPALVQEALMTLSRWLESGDVRSAGLWREWERILKAGSWRRILGRTQRAQQLRQASPLVAALPEAVRIAIHGQAQKLKDGVGWGVAVPIHQCCSGSAIPTDKLSVP